MHYGPSPIEETDLTEVNVFFAEEPIEREVETGIMGPQHLDQFFYLPANQERTFHGTMDVAADVSLLSVAPHCHLIGESWEVFATSPNNQTRFRSSPFLLGTSTGRASSLSRR